LIKLEDSGHYHPDIKLSNFLYDDGRVFCADRKTFINTEQAPIGNILTTPHHAPPEFLDKVHIDFKNATMTPKKRSDRIDMLSFMQYQVGSAIGEYLDNTRALNDNPLSNHVQNLRVLQTELMRKNPNDRLKLQEFNQLINQTDKNPSVFLAQLEELYPNKDLSFNQDIMALEKLLSESNPSLEQVSEMIKALPEGALNDARYQSVRSKVEKQINKLEKQVHNQDKALATRTERTLDFLGIQRVPERAQSEQIKKLLSALKELIEPKQVEQAAQAESVISESLSDNSTMVAEPYSSGTFVQKSIDVDFFEFDDLVVRDRPSSSNADTEVNGYSPEPFEASSTMKMAPEQSPKPENIANILKSMFEETRPEQEADDIDTTIERGNAKQSLKDALNEIKEEKPSGEYEQEKKYDPGSTPKL